VRRQIQHPARLVPLAFLAAIATGTLLFMLPGVRAGGGRTPLLTALFTSASAVCVTGLSTVDTASYWTGFGRLLILLLMQLGGFGIVTAATLLTVAVSHRMGLRTRLLAQAEERSLGIADARKILVRIALTMLTGEGIIAAVLAARFIVGYHMGVGRALWSGVFHAVSAFNNVGFSLYSNSLDGFVGDWWICVPITLGVIAGSLGFPVLFELARGWRRPSRWSTHTRLTVVGTIALLAIGFVVMLSFEWNHAFAPFGNSTKVLAAFTQGSMPRSGGFFSVDIAHLRLETLVVMIGLMFIGGSSAGTAGGIKLTTFLLLAYVIWAEIKGEPDVVIGRRRMAEPVQRQALTVALLGVAIVAVGTLGLLASASHLNLIDALFETTSAFGTVGLSTGITPRLGAAAQIVLVASMFVGRVGTIAVASSLALRNRPRHYRYPEERPIVG
jgi:potassium uptake TrkH family protein